LYAEFPITLNEGISFIWPSWSNPDDWYNDFELKIHLNGLASGKVYQGSDNGLLIIYSPGRGFSYWSDGTSTDTLTVKKWEGSGGVFEGSFEGKLFKHMDDSKTMVVSGNFSIVIE